MVQRAQSSPTAAPPHSGSSSELVDSGRDIFSVCGWWQARCAAIAQRTAHPVLPMNEMKATREMQNSVALLALRRLLSVKAEDKGSFHLRERKDNLGQHVDHIGPPADEKE